ncbi:MAG: O-acetylhomoserine aminocarboxypropyltransferase [Spirochaetes bacterium GWF1_31_7]|nr:MAG: O-acetylhomoserine aminocarboxypropyltransferase [Spirochaetes bacterium GWE1_32_154]OHD51152.1 MAG: O-acetylhomoserine aminocarboxypropyltransferase [Spirochaetes bacterium GWE2_31_10]OHD52071.1 MAG: O-acetylhomoserine aminocarboxypropyltransferase [Spirochaetes bacterium GWF1_31_7]OHD80853.1 MAG: O-acetylhomoserine aminocarboxypropyltransferase [Spirochaetes bacterium RIFOXYB1_FULL_32_8]HBD96470.1 O-acetylhomoserine aminocarboxypropyltransferase [Spirochaetia bacterium]
MSLNFETLALHAGQKPDTDTLSRAVPIHRTSAYVFKNTEHAANLFALKEAGYIYTRLNNPTQDVLEQRIAALEGAPAALAIASGTSAIFYAIINILSQGDEIVSANNLYGGTYTMFNDILPQFGIKTVFVDPKNPENFKKAITSKTRAIFSETIGNPSLDVVDFEAIGKIAQEAEIPYIVDSTFTTPYLFNPLKHGANIVIHSLTKWIGGHGTGIGGIVVDGGNFNWKNPKFTLFNEPDNSYHGLRYAHDLGDLSAVAYIVRLRLVPLRNLGACLAPDNAWLFIQGLETLALRMERHSTNALRVAEYLKKHPKVEWVKYPGLKDDSSYQLASKYFKKGCGGMVVFGIKGGSVAGKKFIESTKIFSLLANVGDAKSLAIHPATTTHSQLTEEQQKESGIAPELVRLSIGIENIDDIIGDLEQALLLV